MLLITGDGKIISTNPAAVREFAGAESSLTGKPLSDLVLNSPENLERFLRLCSRTRAAVPGSLLLNSHDDGEAKGVPYRVEGALICPRDGESPALLQLRFRTGEAANHRFQFLNERIADLSQEIHARRRAEQALVENSKHLQFILESTGVGLWKAEYPFGVLEWDARTRKLLFFDDVSPPTIELFFDRLHPDDREPTRRAVEEAILGGVNYSVDHRAVDPGSGQVRWLNSTGTATLSAEGKCLRLDGITFDITERKETEEELRDLAEQLADADERKDVFLATLAHELRNPLAPIRTGLEILKMKADDVATVKKIQGVMESQALQLTVLVNDLLDISRFTRGKIAIRPSKVSLNQILHNSVEISRPLIDEFNHTLTLDLPDPSPDVTVDSHRVSQIVSNLLNNAAKYTQPGGEIELSAETDGDDFVVKVSDNGMGISGENQKAIFDIFHQLPPSPDRTNAGLGIGLTLVKRLVELHNGSIAVSSEGENCGSVFEVRLPVTFSEEKSPSGSA